MRRRARRCNNPLVAFWAKVNKTTTCWLWTAALFKAGYGAFRVNGRVEYAHRHSWFIHNGPILNGLQVCHSCDVRACVNPAHLFLGTQKDNMDDMFNKGRSSKGARHGLALLTWDQVKRIRALYAEGYLSRDEIGVMFGVSRHTITAIGKNKRWVIK